MLETSRRELSEDVLFDIGTGTLLVVEQSSLENPPQGYVMIHRQIQKPFRDPDRRGIQMSCMAVVV